MKQTQKHLKKLRRSKKVQKDLNKKRSREAYTKSPKRQKDQK